MFHWMMVRLIRPVPLTVSVKAASPAVAEVGAIDVNCGITGLMVNVTAFETMEVPFGPGFATVTLAVAGRISRPAAMVAVSCVGDTKVVLSGAPSHCTMDACTKPVPVTDNVKVASPTRAESGVMLVMVGAAAVIANCAGAEGAPFGLATVTCAGPGWAIRFAETDAVSCVGPTTVVVSAVPLNVATAPSRKFVPFTVSVNAGPPATAVLGDRLVIVGTGGFTARGSGFDGPLSGLVTVTGILPGR